MSVYVHDYTLSLSQCMLLVCLLSSLLFFVRLSVCVCACVCMSKCVFQEDKTVELKQSATDVQDNTRLSLCEIHRDTGASHIWSPLLPQ